MLIKKIYLTTKLYLKLDKENYLTVRNQIKSDSKNIRNYKAHLIETFEGFMNSCQYYNPEEINQLVKNIKIGFNNSYKLIQTYNIEEELSFFLEEIEESFNNLQMKDVDLEIVSKEKYAEIFSYRFNLFIYSVEKLVFYTNEYLNINKLQGTNKMLFKRVYYNIKILFNFGIYTFKVNNKINKDRIYHFKNIYLQHIAQILDLLYDNKDYSEDMFIILQNIKIIYEDIIELIKSNCYIEDTEKLYLNLVRQFDELKMDEDKYLDLSMENYSKMFNNKLECFKDSIIKDIEILEYMKKDSYSFSEVK